MAKFYGKIGYAVSTEVTPGVWDDVISGREYFGDIIKDNSRWNANPTTVNNDLSLSNQISIIADPYANENFQQMRYVEFMGGLWEITSVGVLDRPRLLLSLGRVS